ncbi:phosphatidylinositol phosphate synthase [Corynebacterium heidelbergense]|uniref:Phosphatidylinositol phosphate synthase n=1 Tax=Corynebacterium heidelbergense TaxID=2055947 RepID=A0A364VD87_9CORY|nr:CDP-alcohol phosphatidyltransferase family protein [Corynebacterium heidelbergense]RAV34591.1 phosphatidylglycerophosphate synthase [Corynebacterium heidelbergense]WCZ36640.1 CDP-diacylglycerol--inositol 3-phosphatidyltransferase [Corynebacterium heidelbergense]
MLSVHGRRPAAVVIEPVARKLLSWGLTPNMVTAGSTAAAVAAAVGLIPTGHHAAAAILMGLIVCTDMVDGTMARLRGGGTRFGATLDASCDRIADGALFGAIALDFALHRPGESVLLALTLIILVASQVTSYVKARAEASGIKVVGGFIERPERLIIGLVSLGLSGFGVPYILAAGLWILCLGSVYTVAERLVIVGRSNIAGEGIAAPEGAREFQRGSRIQEGR